MNRSQMLYNIICETMTEKGFLKQINMTEREIGDILVREDWKGIAAELLEEADEKGRFSLKKMEEAARPTLEKFSSEPEEGWLNHTYQHILGTLFPEKQTISQQQAEQYVKGRIFVLQIMKALHAYEMEHMEFDPTRDLIFLTADDINRNGDNKEYLRFIRLSRMHYIYEFMRIGTEITPFNTLGHIAGVHYVAMHAAYQLRALKVPVDLGLVSGAAAGHDIGKYGCKKSEERRIPYLHYYYTDLCLNRFNMPMIAHIAANHSTWDLELENLSVEALLLIYADFRVKSSRNERGEEVVHFYSLKDAFQVILDKLDNVDEAKEHRYRKVYNKLKDFEDYMIDLGVNVDLPDKYTWYPESPQQAVKIDAALIENNQVVKEMKYVAVDHNIRVMSKFYQEDEFSSLLESARSETKWKNLRTYISIFREYSTYMTEKQKLMTIRFLFELLVHKESDIRQQAGEIMGHLIARFNEEYKKELPEGVRLPEKKVTNLLIWQNTVERIMSPDHRLTDQHKRWMEGCLKKMVEGLMASCSSGRHNEYIDVMHDYIIY